MIRHTLAAWTVLFSFAFPLLCACSAKSKSESSAKDDDDDDDKKKKKSKKPKKTTKRPTDTEIKAACERAIKIGAWASNSGALGRCEAGLKSEMDDPATAKQGLGKYDCMLSEAGLDAYNQCQRKLDPASQVKAGKEIKLEPQFLKDGARVSCSAGVGREGCQGPAPEVANCSDRGR